MDIEISQRTLPLRFTWKISRGADNVKNNLFVSIKSPEFSVWGESAAITKGASKFRNPEALLRKAIQSDITPDALLGLPAYLRFALDSALMEFNSRMTGESIPAIFGLQTVNKIPTSFSIPISSPGDIPRFIEENELQRFPSLKVKLGFDNKFETVEKVLQNYAGPIRIDANEAFLSKNQVLHFLEDIPDLSRIEFLEQPLPSANIKEYIELKKISPVPIVADESIQDGDIDGLIVDQFHGINVKMMKAGSYQQAAHQLDSARRQGLKTMLGCMVETSVGIRAAVQLADKVDWYDLDGFLLLKEDPFGLLREQNGYLELA